MTILSVCREVCPVIGLAIPESVFSSTEREHVELQALANEMAQRIAFDTRDWTRLKKIATLTGNGSAESFDLPSDYKRMLKKALLWPSATPYSPLTHYRDTDRWLAMTVQNFQQTVGSWTLIGDQIFVLPVLASGATVKFYYIKDQIVRLNGGGTSSRFVNDSDTFVLDERVLRLGMIWQWKANKGLPYAEDMATYEDALAVASGSDSGQATIVVGHVRTTLDVDLAYPGTIAT